MTTGQMSARLAPTDRRSPVAVVRGDCPLKESCFCCPNTIQRWHGGRSQRTCKEAHPPQDRMCSPPFPAQIPPCPERQTLQQDPPPPPTGHRQLSFACCVDCGRVTARRWTDQEDRILPWCAGQFPTQQDDEGDPSDDHS